MLREQRLARNSSSLFQTILFTGFLAGLLDIVAAMLLYYFSTNKNPLNILPYIASGVLGEKAFSGGVEMKVLGIFLHFIIAYAFTTFFFLIYPKFSLLSKNRFIGAIVIGLLVWCIMNLAVVPVSNTPKAPFNWANAIKNAVVLIIAIGIPISLMAHRYWQQKHLN